MRRVLAAPAAELAELEPLGALAPVLGRAVVPALTFRAGQRDDLAHDSVRSLSDFRLQAHGPGMHAVSDILGPWAFGRGPIP